MFYWKSLAFLMIQWMLAIWSLVPLPLLKPAWTSGSSWLTYCWSLVWRILSITLLACAAAAESLQSYPTLHNPTDGSPPGSPILGILQARTLEWVAISFSSVWKWKVKVKLLSRVWLSNPMDCSLPGSSIHGIFQATVLEWGAIAFSYQRVRWVQLCDSLSILWDCLSLGLEWKLNFSSPMATAEFSKLSGILSAALSQHHLSGFEIAQLEFHHFH